MALNPVKHAHGTQLLIMVGDGATPEVFKAFCTVNAARNVVGEVSTNDFNIPDCDNMEAVGWLVREKVALQYTAQGAGILNTPDVQEFADWLVEPNPRHCQIIVDVPAADGGVIFDGNFHLTHFEITGNRGGKMEATVNIISDGIITVTATTAVALADTKRAARESQAAHQASTSTAAAAA